MWSAFLDPQLHLVHAPRRQLRHFGQELVHFAVHRDDRCVLWCDGDHGFNPYHFAELNLERGFAADDGGDRVLIKRCMTAFNWELALDRHIEEKLETTDVSMVVMSPYDALFCHQELQDWEQEDYVRYSMEHLRKVARRRQVPLLAMVDMERLWQTHPVLAQVMFERAQRRWRVDHPGGRWRAIDQMTGEAIDPYLRRQSTLLDHLPLAETLADGGKRRRAAREVVQGVQATDGIIQSRGGRFGAR